jgi:hypothetical protein
MPHSLRKALAGASLAALAAAAMPAFAQTPADTAQAALAGPQTVETVIIYGRAFEQIGEAQSASEGVVGYADLSTRPISRAAELV